MLKEPTRRIRFLTRNEAERLLAALPEHLADMAAFSLATGLGRANATGLQGSQVDLVRRIAWVHPDQAKARRAIAVPLNAEAVVNVRNSLGSTLRTFSASGLGRWSRSAPKPGTRLWRRRESRISAGMATRIAAEHLAPYADRLCALRVVEAAGDGTNPSQATNDKGLAPAKPLSCLARPAGLEPTTPWFVAEPEELSYALNSFSINPLEGTGRGLGALRNAPISLMSRTNSGFRQNPAKAMR